MYVAITGRHASADAALGDRRYNMKRTQLILLTILMAVSALLVVGCNEDRTMIGSILDRPHHYYDNDVIIAGRVTDTHSASIFSGGVGAYQVDDGSGRIWVITRDGVPYRGDEVGLKGRVDDGVRLFGNRLGTVVQEHERRIRHSSDYDRNRDRDWNNNRDRDTNRDHNWDSDHR
jgi:hypothetical protein